MRRRDDLHPRPAPQLRGPRGIERRGKLYHHGLGPHEGAHGFHMEALGSGGVEPPAPDQRPHRHGEVTGEGIKVGCIPGPHSAVVTLFILSVSVLSASPPGGARVRFRFASTWTCTLVNCHLRVPEEGLRSIVRGGGQAGCDSPRCRGAEN
jgi:hypothetical protein